jgi:hypothetical protein
MSAKNMDEPIGRDFELNTNLNRLTISTNSQDLDAIVEAVNESIRIDLAAKAEAAGTDSTVNFKFSKKDLFDRYRYRRIKIHRNWYQHIFTLKSSRIITN